MLQVQGLEELLLLIIKGVGEPYFTVGAGGFSHTKIRNRMHDILPDHIHTTFSEPYQYHRDKTDEHMSTDPVVQMMIDRPYLNNMLQIPEYLFYEPVKIFV